MASEAQIAANRRNARRSTGPKTAAGKARVAQNAIRHGLTGPVLREGSAGARIAQLVDAFLGDGLRSEVTKEAAVRAAEAQFLAEQTRLARVVLLDEADPAQPPGTSAKTRRARDKAKQSVAAVPADVMGAERKQRFLDFFALQEELDAPIALSNSQERQAAALDAAGLRLQRLDRYERRALSRRRSALAELADEQQVDGVADNGRRRRTMK